MSTSQLVLFIISIVLAATCGTFAYMTKKENSRLHQVVEQQQDELARCSEEAIDSLQSVILDKTHDLSLAKAQLVEKNKQIASHQRSFVSLQQEHEKSVNQLVLTQKRELSSAYSRAKERYKEGLAEGALTVYESIQIGVDTRRETRWLFWEDTYQTVSLTVAGRQFYNHTFLVDKEESPAGVALAVLPFAGDLVTAARGAKVVRAAF